MNTKEKIVEALEDEKILIGCYETGLRAIMKSSRLKELFKLKEVKQ